MRQLFYRIAALRLMPEGAGCRYEAWIVVNGLGRAARGRCAVTADLEQALMEHVRAWYTEVTGRPLPTPDGQLPLL